MIKNKTIFTPFIKKILNKQSEKQENSIFVFLGIEDYVDINDFKEHIIDLETFGKDGNEDVFDDDWLDKTTSSLKETDSFSILSFPQFSYLLDSFNPDRFERRYKDRLIIVKDNLRSMFPISNEQYIEQTGTENIEERPQDMPVYEAQQYKVGSNCYYSAKMPMINVRQIDFFQKGRDLKDSNRESGDEVIDASINPYAIDWFVNDCIVKGCFNRKIIVKYFDKQPFSDDVQNKLEKLNYLLGLFGGEVCRLNERAIGREYTPKNETIGLLHRYWGEDATFRNLNVYKNPDNSKDIVPISQGFIVDTMIDEYNNSNDPTKDVRDLFLTAPTGAGKSLLFQLPAFYIADRGDVTIVVSPLIALMKDQVSQIRQERRFNKVQYLNSELSLIDRDRIIESCKQGETDILYMSPELLLSYDISFFIGDRHLGLLVVDEAHLITTWGRDFRVDYWYLGNYINKIRKFHDYRFPMMAVTATAIYGGDNDMVFDGANSLSMHNPHYFIGEVKRSNINFVIDNHDNFTNNYDVRKEEETVKFIRGINDLGAKTIVYAPYRRHIERLMDKLNQNNLQNIAVAYHSGMPQDIKESNYQKFRNGEAKVMIATKAFGMGVDIPDIQVVYHHAPSGLLPDYVQEIGRAARIPGMQGFAALSYSENDQRYSKQLFGMSSLKQYQLREVLKKVYKTFEANGRKRNMLVSTNDFGYIFNDSGDLDQKVSTALMMLEKNYLATVRFNVLIARPKKLFVKVYARTDEVGLDILNNSYGDYFTFITSTGQGRNNYIELDLDKLWKDFYSDRSFPLIKRDFYNKELLKEVHVKLDPQVKVTFTVDDYEGALSEINDLFKALKISFGNLTGRFFSDKDFKEELSNRLTFTKNIEKVCKFILGTFSGRLSNPNVSDDAFLQKRHNNTGEEVYRVFSNKYANIFANIKKRFSYMFEGKTYNKQSRFLSSDGNVLLDHIRLGSILEILELGSFETAGGENPMIFIRINDPLRIKRDSSNPKYEVDMLKKIKNRHEISSEIFDHFFLHSFSNDERWNFIEDFFLGASKDDLIVTYPGGERNHVDILEYINTHKNDISERNNGEELEDFGSDVFIARDGEMYYDDNLLTIDRSTMTVSKWITKDPVAFDKERRKHNFEITPTSKVLLMNRLRSEHYEYYRDVMGLNLKIEFKGYDNEVIARIPYEEVPVKFYKWLRKNQNKVYLKKEEYIKLLLEVNRQNPKALVRSDRSILKNRRI